VLATTSTQWQMFSLSVKETQLRAVGTRLL
jgi:hypothetical protein